MELLYIWIDSYKNIHRQGFNFSPKYRFDFTPTTFEKDEEGNETVTGGHLTYKENKDFPKDFFSKGISNVTAIIGENGSGKSSLLEALLESSKYIFSIEKNENEQFVMRMRKGSNINISSNININYDLDNTEVKHLEEIPPIYISNAITSYKNNIPSNLSLPNLVQKDNENNNDSRKIFDIYHSKNIIRQLALLKYYHNKKGEQELDFLTKIPNKLILSFVDIENSDKDKVRTDIYEKSKSNTIFAGYNKLFKNHEEFLEELCRNGIIETLMRISLPYEEIVEFVSQNMEVMNSRLLFNEIDKKFCSSILKVEKTVDNLERSILAGLDKYISINNGELSIDIAQSNLSNIESLFEPIIKLFKSPFCRYDVELSTGENYFLSFFSNIFTQKHVLNPDSNRNIILIDEYEMGLHPQWQKEYLKTILSKLPSIFSQNRIPLSDIKIQIILTSHSPFLVSDLPKENIIFLAKDKETGKCLVKNSLNDMKQTFGANIHTLLTDSFFMQDKGLMGKFAEENINAVITWINEGNNEKINNLARSNSKTEIEIVQWLIKQIGEPIIRNQLQKMLDSRRLEKVETHEEQIRKLESSMRFLQKQIEQLKNKK